VNDPAVAPADSWCAAHADRPALHICGRCGSFVCIDCLVWRDDAPFCSRCVPKTLRDASWPAIGSAILGFASVGCGPLALIAIPLGLFDLARIGMGHSPRDGAKLDATGIALGVIGLLIGAAILYRFATGAISGREFD
jgi:hypothetical protein